MSSFSSSSKRPFTRAIVSMFASVIMSTLLATTGACNTKPSPVRPTYTPTNIKNSVFSKETITIGLKNDQPGTSVVKDYRWSGLDYDLANYIAKSLGVQMNPLDVPSKDRMAYLQNGRADLIISTFSYTQKRAQQVDMAGPYLTTPQSVLVKSKDHSIKNTSDLKGKTVCATIGSTSLDEIRRPGYGISPKEEYDFSSCVDDLKKGIVQAVSTDQVILYGFVQHNKDLRVVPHAELGSLNRYVVGLPPGHKDDCERVASIIKRFLNESHWDDSFRNDLPAAVDADNYWQNHFKPSPEDVRCWAQ